MGEVPDLVGEITARFGALETELNRTRGELEEARRKLASYEGFDVGLRETIAAAVAKAQEDLLPRLTALRDELARTELERDALRAEVGKLRDERASLERAVSELRPESSALRRASAENLRTILNEVVVELRRELAAVERPPVQAASTAPVASPPRIPTATAPAPPAPPPAPTVTPRPTPAPTTPATPSPVPQATAPAAPAAALPSRPAAAPAPAPAPPPSRSIVEDVEEFTPRAAPATAPVPAMAALGTEPHQIELVLRSVRSFPQLIAIENRIQSFPGVSRVYMHRTGVDGSATLTVQLEPQMGRDDFAAALGRNDRPQITVDNVAGDQIEATVSQ